jgi:hypothetical protein
MLFILDWQNNQQHNLESKERYSGASCIPFSELSNATKYSPEIWSPSVEPLYPQGISA